MKTISKIDVWPAAKMSAALGVAGWLMAVVLILFTGVFRHDIGPMPMGLGPVIVLVLLVMYLIFGFVAGAVFAAAYNLFARWVGGIRVQLDD